MNDSNSDEIFAAARAGDSELVLELIDNDRSLLNVTNANQTTPLVIALEQENFELAERLIERGANVFAMDHADHWAMGMITKRNKLRAADRQRLVAAVIATGNWEMNCFRPCGAATTNKPKRFWLPIPNWQRRDWQIQQAVVASTTHYLIAV